MPTTSIGRESCRGEVRPGLTCLTHKQGRPYSGDGHISEGSYWPPGSGAQGARVARGRYNIPRWWEADPAAAEEVAGWAGAAIEDLLCRGCLARRTRLTQEGLY